MSGFKDTAPKSDSADGDTPEGSDAFVEEYKNWVEEYEAKTPRPIFLGAILAHDNALVTNEQRLIELFRAMQEGQFEYPESMSPRVEDVRIVDDRRYIFPQSEQIDFLMRSRYFGLGVSWTWQQSKKTGYYIGDRYSVDQDMAEHFLKEWGEDEEAMEFFTRCGKFLELK